MSVDFYPALVTAEGTCPALRCACEAMGVDAEDFDARCAACRATVNVSNVNASDLLEYLGLESAPCGHIEASKLAALCRARLAMVNVEEARPTVKRGRVIECGRDAGYLHNKTRALLVVAMLARSCGWVAWS